MTRHATRIFQEMPLIEKILHGRIEAYDPASDETVNEAMRQLLHLDVPEKADSFVTSLYAIAQDMTFDEWNDFWFDMGIRIFGEDEDTDYG